MWRHFAEIHWDRGGTHEQMHVSEGHLEGRGYLDEDTLLGDAQKDANTEGQLEGGVAPGQRHDPAKNEGT